MKTATQKRDARLDINRTLGRDSSKVTTRRSREAPDPLIRQELSGLSGWPTIPQLFVDGRLVGGCDIVTEMFESGELAEALGVEQPTEAPDSAAAAAAQQTEPAAAAAQQ